MAESKTRIKEKTQAEINEQAMRKLNRLMIESAVNLANKIEAKAVFIAADACRDGAIGDKQLKHPKIVLVTKDEKSLPEEVKKFAKHIIKIPSVKLTRMGQVKMAVVMALNAELVDQGDKIVCLTGVPELGGLDTVVILDIGREFEVISSEDVRSLSEHVKPAIFEAVLNMAIELAHQGREGKSVGTTFVIGDVEAVLAHSKQLTINPFKGYPEEDRNILDPQVRESIKGFSAIDGAFIIRDDGVVVTAGRHLNAAFEDGELPQGLGSRHASAAGITSVTNATAIVVSESTGDVRIFRNGKIFMTIEKTAM